MKQTVLLVVLFLLELRISFACLPDYVPDHKTSEARDKQINIDYYEAFKHNYEGKEYIIRNDCVCGVPLARFRNYADCTKLEIDEDAWLYDEAIEAYPWHIFIQFDERRRSCAGTLINNKMILTNAQCFIDLTEEITYAQALYGTQSNDAFSGYDIEHIKLYSQVFNPVQDFVDRELVGVEIDKIILHPNVTLQYFLDRTVAYDFALILLKEGLNFSDPRYSDVSPVCIINEAFWINNDKDTFYKVHGLEEADHFAIGWGEESPFVPELSDYIPEYREHNLRTVDQLYRFYENTETSVRVAYNPNLTDLQSRAISSIKHYIGQDGYGGPVMSASETTSSTDGPLFLRGLLSRHEEGEIDLFLPYKNWAQLVSVVSKSIGAEFCPIPGDYTDCDFNTGPDCGPGNEHCFSYADYINNVDNLDYGTYTIHDYLPSKATTETETITTETSDQPSVNQSTETETITTETSDQPSVNQSTAQAP